MRNFLKWFALWYTGKSIEDLSTIDSYHYFFTRSRTRSYCLTVFGRWLSILLILSASSAYALPGEQINSDAIQTLTNKTLTAPTITDPEITGSVTGGATFDAPVLTSPQIDGAIAGSASWDEPGAIGGTTPAVGTFSTLRGATSVIVGATPTLTSGTGSPEGVKTQPVGSLFLRTDGSTATTVYVKESGAGNTGWVAIGAGGAVSLTAPGPIGSVTPNTGAFTTLSVTGQFTSTVSTGTAPYVVASTTKVSNLNADLLDGGDWAAPIAIGTTTPAAITGTTITATGCAVIIVQKICSGAGSPEGVLTAPVGSLYQRNDGASGTTLYSKEAGSGNVGWAALAPSTINWAVAGTIGSTTPNTGVFTTITGTRMISGFPSPTYGATVAIDASLGNAAQIVVTDASALTISNPTNPASGQWLSIMVKNTSGGVMSTPTWDTAYKMATFTKPATGFRRTVTFLYDGTNWVEINCSPQVPN